MTDENTPKVSVIDEFQDRLVVEYDPNFPDDNCFEVSISSLHEEAPWVTDFLLTYDEMLMLYNFIGRHLSIEAARATQGVDRVGLFDQLFGRVQEARKAQ
jgi:hypothetical protein